MIFACYIQGCILVIRKMTFTADDMFFMQRAIQLALDAELEGNSPVGSVIVLDNKIIAESGNKALSPIYDPGGHAEMSAMNKVEKSLWFRARGMTCYTTLEPCCMCFGRLLLAGVGRIVFGALDTMGGSGCLIPHLPKFYHQDNTPEFVGPIAADQCDELYKRTAATFNKVISRISS